MSRVVLVRGWRAVLVVGMLGVAAAAVAAPQDPVRVGGAIKEPRKITTVDPVYPEQAVTAGLQGMVILEATIGRNRDDGRREFHPEIAVAAVCD